MAIRFRILLTLQTLPNLWPYGNLLIFAGYWN